MTFSNSAELIRGQIDGPIRLSLKWKDKAPYTLISFDMDGKTMEMTGRCTYSPMDRKPVSPPFSAYDTAAVLARPMGNGVYKVISMNVPRVAFTYGNAGSVLRLTFSIGMILSLIVFRSQLDLPPGNANGFNEMLIVGVVICCCLGATGYKAMRAVRLVRNAAAGTAHPLQ